MLIAARDFAKGERAASEIRAAVAGAQVEARRLDLASFQSVRDFASGILREGVSVDVLLHNAGVLTPSKTRRVTIDGIEETLGVNVLGPFLLTRELLPALERSAGARVVCVSSRLHLPSAPGTPPRFDFDDPQQTRDYRAGRAYRNSKLALIWFTYELRRRLPPRRITANAICPGFVPVTGAADATGFWRLMLRYVLPRMPFATSVDTASHELARMATDPALDGVGAAFFMDGRAAASSAESYDMEKARRFWRLACELLGIDEWLPAGESTKTHTSPPARLR